MNNKPNHNKTRVILLASTALVLSGCAMPHVVEKTHISDTDLDCASLQMEITEAKRYEQDAIAEKGITGHNVVAVLFFWPAVLGNAGNANAAIDAARARQKHLLTIYDEKDC